MNDVSNSSIIDNSPKINEADVDVPMYCLATNTLTMIINTIGIRRVPRPTNDGHDILLKAHKVD